MRRVSAKFVPRLFTDDQKENRIEISQELFANANGNENFLKKIITGDERWVYGYGVETKMRSSQWMGKGSPPPKKARISQSKIKVMLVVFFWLERHFPTWICTKWSDGKQTVLPGSFSAFEGRCAQEEAWIVGKVDLDVAPRQCAGSRVAPRQQLSGKTSDIRCTSSTLFSGLSPSKFFLFPKLKTTLKRRRFQTIESQENAIREPRAITENAF